MIFTYKHLLFNFVSCLFNIVYFVLPSCYRLFFKYLWFFNFYMSHSFPRNFFTNDSHFQLFRSCFG